MRKEKKAGGDKRWNVTGVEAVRIKEIEES